MSETSTHESGAGARSRNAHKSRQAFRTISEVADNLDLPQHVLRFWETKFTQISPLKRGGGRRYYRPEDVELLRSIKSLLHFDGYTIKGVQKLLSNGGLKNLQSAAKPDGDDVASPVLSVAKTADETGPALDTDVLELAVLVGELEDIRDQLKKSLS